MKTLKILVTITIIAALSIGLLAGCGQKAASPDAGSERAASEKPQILKVGATDGPFAQILEAVKPILAKENIDLQVVVFNDYVRPNIALSEGEIDANTFQHIPYFEKFTKDRNLKLSIIGKTIILPMAIYSKKYKSLDELPEGAKIAIPNDPTNGGRALILFARGGLFKLKDGVGINATVNDIVENKKNIKVLEVEAAQTPRVLPDVDAAAINSNYAIPLGLNPQKDSILVEDANSPYVCIAAVRTEDRDKPIFKKFMEAYQSPEIKKFIQDTFKGSVIPAF